MEVYKNYSRDMAIVFIISRLKLDNIPFNLETYCLEGMMLEIQDTTITIGDDTIKFSSSKINITVGIREPQLSLLELLDKFVKQ